MHDNFPLRILHFPFNANNFDNNLIICTRCMFHFLYANTYTYLTCNIRISNIKIEANINHSFIHFNTCPFLYLILCSSFPLLVCMCCIRAYYTFILSLCFAVGKREQQQTDMKRIIKTLEK